MPVTMADGLLTVGHLLLVLSGLSPYKSLGVPGSPLVAIHRLGGLSQHDLRS